MRFTSCLTLVAAALIPAAAEANCYTVYDAQNRLSYQSNVTPIDLSIHISDAMRTRFPSGYLVMIPDESACREFRSGSTVRPRFDNLGMTNSTPNEQLMQASPLLRNTRSTEYGAAVSGAAANDVARREAVRTGTSLGIKREAAPTRP
jgi:hypothetical protein